MKQKNLQKEKLNIVYVDVDLLEDSPENPRTWEETAEKDLEKGVKKFGLTEPLLVNAYLAMNKTTIWIITILFFCLQFIGILLYHTNIMQVLWANISAAAALLFALLVYYVYVRRRF